MWRLPVGLLLMSVLLPSPCYAWGPRTHLEIAERVNQTSTDFRAGTILPDFSLAMRYYGDDYPDLQNVTHSQEFVVALEAIASDDFYRGWLAHCQADIVETAYTVQRMTQGAPTSADWPVDTVYRHLAPDITSQHTYWIHEALETVGCHVDYPSATHLNFLYSMYCGVGPGAEYKAIQEGWYADCNDYVQDAADSTTTFRLSAGWNLVAGCVAQRCFALRIGTLYEWDATRRTYTVPSQIDPNKGYWIAVDEDKLV